MKTRIGETMLTLIHYNPLKKVLLPKKTQIGKKTKLNVGFLKFSCVEFTILFGDTIVNMFVYVYVRRGREREHPLTTKRYWRVYFSTSIRHVWAVSQTKRICTRMRGE